MSICDDMKLEKIVDAGKSNQLNDIKLVALDLDGTVLDDNLNISQRTIRQ